MKFTKLINRLAMTFSTALTGLECIEKVKELFWPSRSNEDAGEDWEDVAREEVESDRLVLEIGGEMSRRGDRLVLQRRREEDE